jgi:diguanylate cyclase
MISLKKLIDSTQQDSAPACISADEAEKCSSQSVALLSAYQTAVAAMGANGQRAIPTLGEILHSALARIGNSLNCSSSPESILSSGRMVEEQLVQWADKAQQIQKQSEQSITDLLRLVSESTESTGNRDEKFSREIAALSDHLRKTAGLDSLPAIRRSITEDAGALTVCVARMVEEGRESVRKLTSEVADYQTRLIASERRALADPLTGLCNRRGFEQQLEFRVQFGKPFSLLIVDLNGFKLANDRYGHLVGDEILRQFAIELKAQFPPEDTVARWGGDEFAVIVNGGVKEGMGRADRVRNWALGEYKITVDNGTVCVMVDAALGVTAWNGAESGPELFARADKEMYRMKEKSRALA